MDTSKRLNWDVNTAWKTMLRNVRVYENGLADSHPAWRLARHSKVELKIAGVVGPASDALAELHHSSHQIGGSQASDRKQAVVGPVDRRLERDQELTDEASR